jgi:hypothetical protein
MRYRFGDAFTQVTALIAIAQFYGFTFARRCAGWRCCSANDPAGQSYLGLNRWIASGI